MDGTGSYDPDIGDSIASYEWDLDYDGVTFDADATGPQPTVTFPDDFPAHDMALMVTDLQGESNLATTTLEVFNVAPTVNAGDNQTVFVGDLVSVSASFTDPGVLDTHTATIDWGDGSPEEAGTVDESNGSGTVVSAVPHSYSLPGEYTVTVTVTDDDSGSGNSSFTITVNAHPPDCTGAVPSVMGFWPPSKKFEPVTIIVSDPDGDPLAVEVTGIFQDEPVTKDSFDGIIPNSEPFDTAQIRVDRDGNGDGRVYHIDFTADDGQGGICSGEVKVVVVPHDQDDELTPEFIDSIDGGRKYNSVTGEGPLF